MSSSFSASDLISTINFFNNLLPVIHACKEYDQVSTELQDLKVQIQEINDQILEASAIVLVQAVNSGDKIADELSIQQQSHIMTSCSSDVLKRENRPSPDWKELFRSGQTFKMLWTDPMKSDKQSDSTHSTTMSVAFAEHVYSEIRRFVVVSRHGQNSQSVPITIYDGRADKKKDTVPGEHGLIYTNNQPSLLRSLSKEPQATKKKSGDPGEPYINHGRSYSVDTNVHGCSFSSSSIIQIFKYVTGNLAQLVVGQACTIRNICVNFLSILLRSANVKNNSSRVSFASDKATILGILLYASPVLAESAEIKPSSKIHCSSTVDQNLQEIQKVTAVSDPISVAKKPKLIVIIQVFSGSLHDSSDFSPPHILAACLLATTITVLLFKMTNHQLHFRTFSCAGTIVSILAGMIFAQNGLEFVFRYLFFRVNITMILNTVYHYFAVQSDSVDDEEIGFGTDGKRVMPL